jgi:uncharacterized protein YndB with AHSA1/START domain
MIQISNSIEIARPVKQVFDFVADVENNPKWMPVNRVEKLSADAVGKGTKFKQQFVLMGTPYELEGTITAYEPNKRVSFTYNSPVFLWRGDYLFEPTAKGTRLSARGNVTLAGPLKLMETMFAPKLRKLINDTAPNLKRILES